ncbi:MAG: GNAT family N-acetyltransferase [Acidimicrobiia bacterium]
MGSGCGPVIGDEIVTLRAFTFDDVTDVTVACQDPEITRWTETIPSPYTESDARSWISTHDELRAEGVAFHFAIVDCSGGRLGGAIGVEDLDAASRSATVGYWVAPWARRRGLARHALELLSDWALRSLELIGSTSPR